MTACAWQGTQRTEHITRNRRHEPIKVASATLPRDVFRPQEICIFSVSGLGICQSRKKHEEEDTRGSRFGVSGGGCRPFFPSESRSSPFLKGILFLSFFKKLVHLDKGFRNSPRCARTGKRASFLI